VSTTNNTHGTRWLSLNSAADVLGMPAAARHREAAGIALGPLDAGASIVMVMVLVMPSSPSSVASSSSASSS
jgi:hypothetical protein